MDFDAKKDDSSSEERIHKTKVIRFFGRPIPIILQNDNGPCPLLAICNILLLRNDLKLNTDTEEVSQEKLLSLVAERLIDSNSNVNNKDAGYVQNQQQNISDAIDLLPQLATGIDVNVKFRRIDDFEFTRECAIFDLLDIPLYHGWLVDPQDLETASAIGSKSYNALTGDLVALESKDMMDLHANEDDSVDFVAATTATLGVPSPSLSRSSSFNKHPASDSENPSLRKGDAEEHAELLRVLQLSRNEVSDDNRDSFVDASCEDGICCLTDKSSFSESLSPSGTIDRLERELNPGNEISLEPEVSNNSVCEPSQTETISPKTEFLSSANHSEKDGIVPNNIKHTEVSPRDEHDCFLSKFSLLEEDGVHRETLSTHGVSDSQCLGQNEENVDKMDESYNKQSNTLHSSEIPSTGGIFDGSDDKGSSDGIDICSYGEGRAEETETAKELTSIIDSNEPIYAGEECILESNLMIFENREPLYEGEVALAKQAETGSLDPNDAIPEVEITPYKESETSMKSFQGHNTKFEGELYLLATDQGFINQPDLVWEKLNEVNGDSLFMTESFNEFKIESHVNRTWDEQNAMAKTADYISNIDNMSNEAVCDDNSYDLQLAIALQQQEFQQEPEHNKKAPRTQSGTSTEASKLVTGPQEVDKSTCKSLTSFQRQQPNESKSPSKNRCSLM